MLGELDAGALAGLAVAMPGGCNRATLLGLGNQEQAPDRGGRARGWPRSTARRVGRLAEGGPRTVVQSASTVLTWLAAAVRLSWRCAPWCRPLAATGREAGGGRAAARRRAGVPVLVGLTAVSPATVITFSAVVLGRSGGAVGLTWPSAAPVRRRRLRGLGAGVASWSVMRLCPRSPVGPAPGVVIGAQLDRGRLGVVARPGWPFVASLRWNPRSSQTASASRLQPRFAINPATVSLAAVIAGRPLAKAIHPGWPAFSSP